MLNAFADLAVVRETLQEASDALNQDLGKLIAEGPAEELNLTTNTQPVMLTAAYACYRAWQQAGGPAPAIVAGHSLGEYTALVAAGALAFRTRCRSCASARRRCRRPCRSARAAWPRSWPR